MDAPRPVDTPTVRMHKRQFAWQILVPILVALGILIAAAVLISGGAAVSNRTWADISLIWLTIPVFIFAVFCVVELGFLIYAIARLLRVMPYYTGRVQDLFRMASAGARQIADGVARPVVLVRQAGAVLRSIFNHKS
jgi:hypothetical protein